MKRTVIGNTNSDIFNVKENKKCTVLRTYFYNGESWYRLKDIETNEIFESPSIFWDI